jgi:hypothetical protein
LQNSAQHQENQLNKQDTSDTATSTPAIAIIQTSTTPDLADLLDAMADVVTVCGTILFSLPVGGPTIESLKAQYPNMVVVAQVGISYCVSLPINECEAFLTASDLPDPTAEDSDELIATAEATLVTGFFS